jgi:hypothetical protein
VGLHLIENKGPPVRAQATKGRSAAQFELEFPTSTLFLRKTKRFVRRTLVYTSNRSGRGCVASAAPFAVLLTGSGLFVT